VIVNAFIDEVKLVLLIHDREVMVFGRGGVNGLVFFDYTFGQTEIQVDRHIYESTNILA